MEAIGEWEKGNAGNGASSTNYTSLFFCLALTADRFVRQQNQTTQDPSFFHHDDSSSSSSSSSSRSGKGLL